MGIKKNKIEDDKNIERLRYDARATEAMAQGAPVSVPLGSDGVSEALRRPYLEYEAELRTAISPGVAVLEIGAGSGMHTGVLLEAGANVTASDISSQSLKVLKNRFSSFTLTLNTFVADIEALPFKDHEFDVVAAAGCLSYGENSLVLNEILRVLKPGGKFICVDSLNNSPVYKFNRWIHYLRGNRSLSTLRRMPSLDTLAMYQDRFDSVRLSFFGAVSFCTPVISKIVGGQLAANLSDWVDQKFNIKRSAFKFVMVAIKGR